VENADVQHYFMNLYNIAAHAWSRLMVMTDTMIYHAEISMSEARLHVKVCRMFSALLPCFQVILAYFVLHWLD
jgi:hypothetical protein